MAEATSWCGSACRCVTMSFCGPSTGTTRSQGLSFRMSSAIAPLQHGADALADLPGRRRLDVPDGREDLQHVGRVDLGDGPVCRRGGRHTAPCSATSCVTCHRPRQPPRFCSRTRRAASAKVGTPWTRRFSERGSPPDRASMRLARACSRALASGTSVAAPSPSSRRRPRMTSRWTQLRVPDGWTNRYNPLPSACRPGRRGTDEGGREGLVGVAPPALGSAGRGGGFGYNIHSSIICGNSADFASRLRPSRDPSLCSKYLLSSRLHQTMHDDGRLRTPYGYQGSANTKSPLPPCGRRTSGVRSLGSMPPQLAPPLPVGIARYWRPSTA